MKKGVSLVRNSKENRSKTGQTTIFVILAVFIVVIIGAYYKINLDKEFFERNDIKSDLNQIKSLILECGEEVSKNSLETIGLQGGYYNKPEKNFNLEGIFIPYYYYEREIFYPSKQKIEMELAHYLDDNIGNCLKKINVNNFELNFKNPRTEVFIKDKRVDFEINLLIKISKDIHKTTFELKDFPITIDSELSSILDLAEYYTQSHKEDSSMYCIDCINEMAEEDDLYFDLIPITDVLSLIIISENHTASESYSFEFLNKYTGNEITTDLVVEDDIEIPEALVEGS